MATIGSTTNQTGATTPTSLADLTGAKQMGRDDFLKLLVTQLKNQDPLKPTDNTAFVAELAQFSQLDQSTQQVKLLEQTISNQNAAMQFALLPMIGRSVRAEGAVIQLGNGPAPLTYTLDRDTASTRIAILNQSNQVIRTMELGAQGRGEQTVQWDGRNQNGAPMPAGSYHYEISARDTAGLAVSVATTSILTVTGVRNDGGQSRLVAGDQVIDREAIVELR